MIQFLNSTGNLRAWNNLMYDVYSILTITNYTLAGEENMNKNLRGKTRLRISVFQIPCTLEGRSFINNVSKLTIQNLGNSDLYRLC